MYIWPKQQKGLKMKQRKRTTFSSRAKKMCQFTFSHYIIIITEFQVVVIDCVKNIDSKKNSFYFLNCNFLKMILNTHIFTIFF